MIYTDHKNRVKNVLNGKKEYATGYFWSIQRAFPCNLTIIYHFFYLRKSFYSQTLFCYLLPESQSFVVTMKVVYREQSSDRKLEDKRCENTFTNNSVSLSISLKLN